MSSSSAPWIYTEVTGDLFTSPMTASYAHCISADLALGKGIAVDFKARFGGISELQAQHLTVGGCGVLHRESRYIYNLVTKSQYWHKPTYVTIASSLDAMRDHAIANNVNHICMPKIGCGLDRLRWDFVEGLIKQCFSATLIQITVYTL